MDENKGFENVPDRDEEKNDFPSWMKEAFGDDLRIIDFDLGEPQTAIKEPKGYLCPTHGYVGRTYFEINANFSGALDPDEQNLADLMGPHIGRYCLVCYSEFLTKNLCRLSPIEDDDAS